MSLKTIAWLTSFLSSGHSLLSSANRSAIVMFLLLFVQSSVICKCVSFCLLVWNLSWLSFYPPCGPLAALCTSVTVPVVCCTHRREREEAIWTGSHCSSDHTGRSQNSSPNHNNRPGEKNNDSSYGNISPLSLQSWSFFPYTPYPSLDLTLS